METTHIESGRTTIRLMGDVMIGRLVNNAITKNGDEYVWGNLLPILAAPGINIINLEAALTTCNKKFFKVFNFKADPDKVQVLQKGNIHIANIANNHILDYTYDGLEETLKVLDAANILHTGAGKNLEEARKPAILTKDGLTVAVLGFTDNEPDWKASAMPGTNYVETGDFGAVKDLIHTAREQADIVITSIHWGPNMVERPESIQREFAYQLLQSGVDILHGHSAHIFQGIEIKNKKVILYDCGDFIDDYVVDPELRNDLSFLFEIEVRNKKIAALQLIPVSIKDMQVNLSDPSEASRSLARMQMLSAEFGTDVPENGLISIT